MDIKNRISKIIKEQLCVQESAIKLEASFGVDLGADFLDTIELFMAIEEEFSIEIPDKAAEEIKTVGEMVNYINKALEDHA